MKFEAVSAITGAAIATLGLVWACIWLLSIEGADAKVLVAVWLWAWPAITLGALGGWLAARAWRFLTK